MTAHSRLILCLAVAGAALLTTTGTAAASASRAGGRPPSPCTVSVPFTAGEGGYDTYRIPAAVRTAGGDLLAFAEGRVGSAGDSGDIDVVSRRSTDGGCTWGPLAVVAPGGGDTRGNPAPVVDPRTGHLALVTCFNSGRVTEAQIMRGEVTVEQGRRVFVQTSTDDGRSFSAPREITADAKRADWRWYATGPGHALALTHGPHRGRLVVPANHSAAPPAGSADTGQEAKYYGAHALYSDDGGAHWHLGYVDASYEGAVNANESSAAQLPDGRVYFSARDQNGTSPGNRLGAYSADGGETLEGPFAPQPSLDDVPVVQGSVLQASGAGGPLLFSGPSVPTARAALAVFASRDGGARFTRATTLSDLPAAYSDLVQPDARTLGVLYETGEQGPYERIEFRRVALRSLGG
jgi:sialidase-1